MTEENNVHQESFDCMEADLRPSYERDDLISSAVSVSRRGVQGRLLVAVLHAYLDESSTHPEARLTCSAGYVFSLSGSKKFHNEWGPYLDSKGLDKFHATEVCSRKDGDEIFNKLRDVIQRTSEKGFIRFILSDSVKILVDRPEFKPLVGSPYSLLTLSCMGQIAQYATSRGDEVWYFIEAGDSNEKEMKQFLRQIEDSPELKKKYALGQVTVLPKKDAIQLQSADLLAWSLARVDKEQYIPGLDGFDGWKHWYLPSHEISGFSTVGAQLQGAINGFNGFQRLPS